jgi:iron complex transport system substrate-binding protein
MRLLALIVALSWMPAFSTAAANERAPLSRIVSLAPHLTELAFAAGAGERIVGTVEYSDYPEAARRIPRIGDAFLIDMERVVAIAPDAVLVWDTGTPEQTIERLRSLGLRVEVFSTQRLNDVAAALRRLGVLAGTQEIAERAASRFEGDMQALRAEYKRRSPITVFLQINDQPLYTVNDEQILSEIVSLCGGRNVFANLNALAPAIGIEAVIAADPQAIVSTDASVADASVRWRRWKRMRAVRAANVFTLPPDDLARATPRLVAGAHAMCRALDTAREHLRAIER